MMSKSHAQILSDIAAKVVAEHRVKYRIKPAGHSLPRKLNVPIPQPHTGAEPLHDPSWDYVLPERFQA